MHKAKYWGSATVGERGQMVIPADARKALGIEAGDKLVIFGHEWGKRLIIVKAETVTQYVAQALGDLAALEAQLREDLAEESSGLESAKASE
ncbi:MAG: AbrB/MazE/SpoVT family DNA-binding domain-containing protein [Candidatus Zipacnadales bacterium]